MENSEEKTLYNTKDYNDEPVLYCKHCLSLRIRESDGIDYCDLCGSTEIDKAHISEWESKYEQRYNKKYLKKK